MNKRKIIAINIILLFTLMSIVPSISGSFEKISPLSFIKTNDEIKVPDCVEAGDILIIDVAGYDESEAWKMPGPYNEHAVLYVGNNHFIEADAKNGVEEHNTYAHFYIRAKNLVFLRVKSANLSQKQAAIDWIYDRIGTPYQEPLGFPWYGLKIANPDFPNPAANKWYCMELVWAAYYNQGIDIATKNGVEEHNTYAHFYIRTKNLVFLRVKSANLSQKQAAIDWAYDRIGTPYQEPLGFPWYGLKIANPNFPNPTANKWYCMELVWAAYYNQGIDIATKNGQHSKWGVSGNDIITDDDIEIIYREVNYSTEFAKPYKGIYIANKKIISTFSKTIIIGKIDIEVVTLNENITRVDFYVDDVYKANDTTAPYKWTWDERVSGVKVIKAVACDDFGNQYPAYITVKKFF
jgi:uncharacterized protein YycO